MKKIISIFLISLFLLGCSDNTVYFDKAQPENVKDLNQFPKSYLGNYEDGNTKILTIEKNLIIEKYTYSYVYTKNEIDSNQNYIIKNDYILDKESNKKLLYKNLNDTFIIQETFIDTIFKISEYNVIRKFKGNLILNYNNNDLWRVEILSLEKKVLHHRSFTTTEIFNKLSKISDNQVITDSTQTDTLKMILKPTKKEFKEMLDYRDSLTINLYIKIK